MLKLLGRPNPYDVRQVLWLLEELGLPFKQEAWGRGHRPTSEPAFLPLNPLGTVPVLADGPMVLRESHVILPDLAARERATHLLPQGTAARAQVEQRSELGPAPWSNPWAVTQAVRSMRRGCGGWRRRSAARSPTDIPAGFLVRRWFSP